MVGVVSYLLVNFWFTRGAANRAAMMALLTNRVGDWGYILGLLIAVSVFLSLDTATLFGLAPIVNENILTAITIALTIGVMGKSAQLGLHAWLPHAMEGFKKFSVSKSVRYALSSYKPYLFQKGIGSLTVSGIVATFLLCPFSFVSFYGVIMSLNYTSAEYTYSTSIISSCSICLSSSLVSVNSIITGCMLGDGHIRQGSTTVNGIIKGNARYSMTLKNTKSNKAYLEFLKDEVFNHKTGVLTPYFNPINIKHIGQRSPKEQEILQYNFSTCRSAESSEFWTHLHKRWYIWDKTLLKFIKIVPKDIEKDFCSQSLAHWIMQDGYFDNHGRTNTILLCTENFNKMDLYTLQNVLRNMGIKNSLKIRNKNLKTYRIRISQNSVPYVQSLVKNYIMQGFTYKIGI